ncbi:hypothetical protein [Pseudokineococcus sp. 1T1Z-3]|uniref:hypothetical protein n=1 Tax=Pseudokineococcus sp. 1T1Z-3 TaxID=3132745 RepID=UPI0030973816
MLSPWRGQPAWLGALALTFVALLAYGALVHLVQLLLSGGDPHPHLPGWLSAYFISLTLLDPLAAALLARRRRAGVALAVLIFVTDAAANAVANYAYDDSLGVTPGRIGQALLTALAITAVAAAPVLWRAARRDTAQ